MQPSPGKIHSLPIKILYSLDSSSQSFLTILHDHHDVYVHPSDASGSRSQPQDAVEAYGSCCLKGIAWGICFASPECVPSQHTHDFSVYNLDPFLRSSAHQRSSSAGSSSTSTGGDSWSGKGFLSWALSEPDKGQTLIRGRLVREPEFAGAGLNSADGGLEGLMAAATRNSGGSDGAEGAWGLEIVINLKAVPWASAGGIGARKEFEEMLCKGKEGLGIGSTGAPSVNGASAPPSAGDVVAVANPRPAPVVRPVVQPPRVTASAPTSAPVIKTTTQPNGRTGGANGHAPPLNPTQAARNNSLSNGSRPPPPPRGSSSSAPISSLPASSVPPSSIPMSTTSSAQGTSHASPAPNLQRQNSLPPSSTASTSTAATTKPPPRPLNRPANTHSAAGPSKLPPSSTTPRPNAPAATAGRNREREVTPPPRASPKSPPPTTPSRQTLHALLQSDSKMSPGLARQLANHPALLRLLKAVPATSIKSLQGDQAGSAAGTANGGSGLAPGVDVKPSPAMSDNIPTPASVIANNGEGCCNCGTLETDLWRIKKAKDGSEKKVCNDCGMYFNKHKKMRPPELWGTPQGPPAEKRAKVEDAHGVRSSPRLNRNANSSNGANGHAHGPEESPRKRKRGSVMIPNPSPRRATRAAAKEGLVAPDFGLDMASGGGGSSAAPTNGATGGAVKKEEVIFSPSTMFLTSPIQPPTALGYPGHMAHTGSAPGPIEGESEIDIEALLASFVDTHGEGVESTVDLDSAVANGVGGGGGGEGQFDLEGLLNGTLDPTTSQEMMNFLSTMNWDALAEVGGDVNGEAK